jgi:hypothetical protein
MSVVDSPETSSKNDKKEALKAEAEKLGIPYKELKQQKKDAKSDRKTHKASREAKALEKDQDADLDHTNQKRMRAWSKDEGETDTTTKKASAKEDDGAGSKRRRTRSMDKVEQDKETKKATTDKDADATNGDEDENLEPKAWRKKYELTVLKKDELSYEPPAPFINFTDAPFGAGIQLALQRAGFAKPTLIQSQVSYTTFCCAAFRVFLHLAFFHVCVWSVSYLVKSLFLSCSQK